MNARRLFRALGAGRARGGQQGRSGGEGQEGPAIDHRMFPSSGDGVVYLLDPFDACGNQTGTVARLSLRISSICE